MIKKEVVEQGQLWIMNQVKRYGAVFVLLLIAVWYFYKEDEKQDLKIEALHIEIKQCNERVIQMYQDDHTKMLDVISKNTQAFEKLVE